ncbi:ragulator complex protein LAMTOR4 homolog [Aedes aegypti]|uniref:Late endosomal/lysosomal adaptor and MAPK and MTOR activator 4 n=1 Tax=Aedes aegypti TaxID=7159 RepID=A0A6I8TZ39_AEDAE|nr:ragulator complex protein LAMTOR4 homolog [Aedes aegypti]XP_021699206.1 ragulator complex protein LAMTOR4 homolog [Aedes aegypti]XP_021699207.1 ragulator complex protein LAMTOR4 homolog [Aedes aegypti]XP_021699208.1 ragulator complex protein LAMTOR4 homolog [Aedes aegypti]
MLDLDTRPVPDQIGYLIMSEDGAVLASGGEMENDEQSANIISGLLTLTESVDPAVFKKRSCKKISIVYEEHSYTICLSNKKIYVVKRRNGSHQNGGNDVEGRGILA